MGCCMGRKGAWLFIAEAKTAKAGVPRAQQGQA